MPWTSPPISLADGAMVGPERRILEDYLAWQRANLLNICAGLSAEQLVIRAVPPSRLSLLGLVRHMAKVERVWLRDRIAGEPISPLYGGPGNTTDFEDTNAGLAQGAVEQLQQEWASADAAVANISFDYEIDVKGELMSLRMIYMHLIGEYARHNGHADLLRESIDGVTGR